MSLVSRRLMSGPTAAAVRTRSSGAAPRLSVCALGGGGGSDALPSPLSSVLGCSDTPSSPTSSIIVQQRRGLMMRPSPLLRQQQQGEGCGGGRDVGGSTKEEKTYSAAAAATTSTTQTEFYSSSSSSSETVVVEEAVVIEELIVEETTTTTDTTNRIAEDGDGGGEDTPSSSLSPEELEAAREAEQAERFKVFQQQAKAYYAQQQQQQQESQQQGSDDGKGEEEEKVNASNPSSAAAAETGTETPPPPKFSRRFSYVSEADRHRAASNGTTINYNTTTAANSNSKTSNSDASGKANDVENAGDSTTASSAAAPPPPPPVVEVLHPDIIIWETYVEHPDGSKGYVNVVANNAYVATNIMGGDDGRGGGGAGGGGGKAGGHIDGVTSKPAAEVIGGSHFADIAAVDPFSKGKVLNYINRHKDQLPSSSNSNKGGGGAPSKPFEVTEKEIKLGKSAMAAAAGSSWAGAGTSALNNLFGEPDSVFIYRAKLHVPLPPPHSSYVCEGMAESEKDAECLAAMHAERVIDALGVPLYRLPSAQTKHAEAARKAGRKAPFPTDGIMPEGTPIPMPLRMISTQIGDIILKKFGDSDGRSADDILNGGKGGGDASSGAAASSSRLSCFHEHFSLGGACHEAEIIEPIATTSHMKKAADNSNSSSAAVNPESINLSHLMGLNMTSRQMYMAQHKAKYDAVSAAVGGGGAEAHERGEAANHPSSSPEAATSSAAAAADAAPISPYSITGTTSAFSPPPNEPHNPVDELFHTFHYPWRDGVNIDDTVDPNASPEQVFQREQVLREAQLRQNANRMGFGNTAPTAKFDPTENNTFQITNITSVRFSPSDDSLQLAAIFDKNCLDRLKEWMQVTQGVFDIKSRITASQVAVVGFASRMYVAEIILDEKDPSLVAKGKAVEKDVAILLACMHAELLIDATGRHLFPKNAKRQAKHSTEVQGYGRWAAHPNRPHERPPTSHIPLPLKQQLGVDDMMMDATTSKSLRTPEERLLSAHHEIYSTVYDFIEVNPDPKDCKNAREIMRRWHREVARSRIDDLYVCTRMGDYFRASCVLPVPAQFGTRGGNAIGRSPDQAMDLCALHCLDVLCSLNIPVFRNPAEQANLIAERTRNGQIVPNAAQGIIQPTVAGKRVFIPYSPGYLVEGDKLKPLPPVNDLSYVMGLAKSYEKSFILPIQQQTNEKDILEHGNEARMNVQMYCRRTAGIVDQIPNVFITGYAKGLSVFNVAYLPLMIEKSICHQYGVGRSFPAPLTSGLEMAAAAGSSNGASSTGEAATPSSSSPAGTAASSSSSSSSSAAPATVRSVGDPMVGYYRFLAVGASLKKADAVRMSFLHAAEILKSFGIDHTQEKGRFLINKRPQGQPIPIPAKKVANSPQQKQQQPPPAAASPPPSAAGMKPVKPRRLQSVNAPPAGVTTMTMPASNPNRVSRLQQVAPPVGANSQKIGAAPPPAQQQKTVATPPQPSTPTTAPAAASSVGPAPPVTVPVDAVPDVPIPTSAVMEGSDGTPIDPLTPPAVLPRPFLHPLMKNFFFNAKLQNAQMRRIQQSKSVGFR